MKNNYPKNIKRRDFLEAVDCVYKDCTINYIIALRDALNIIISNRVNNHEDFSGYKGLLTI